MEIAIDEGTRANRPTILLFHVMRADEAFEETAEMVFAVVRESALKHPGRPRTLVLDIEGHRAGRNGAYDPDAYEIMSSFAIGILSPWLTEIWTPLIRTRARRGQREDVPDRLLVLETPTTLDQARDLSHRLGMPVFHSDTGQWVSEVHDTSSERQSKSKNY
ncbi:hypothetical protein ACFQRL_13360 [Microbacterium fluvii]|uniref:Uncharacterized protein n=1 Tax=Microbacterium fluvii TaxID=415215 RepID=A0ABW2HH65_9MICO|nr:hypothetical protein [Microbacterium fluvii]MCU4673578.1 hypothetical protein [Microbacterium fluvii]